METGGEWEETERTREEREDAKFSLPLYTFSVCFSHICSCFILFIGKPDSVHLLRSVSLLVCLSIYLSVCVSVSYHYTPHTHTHTYIPVPITLTTITYLNLTQPSSPLTFLHLTLCLPASTPPTSFLLLPHTFLQFQ